MQIKQNRAKNNILVLLFALKGVLYKCKVIKERNGDDESEK